MCPYMYVYVNSWSNGCLSVMGLTFMPALMTLTLLHLLFQEIEEGIRLTTLFFLNFITKLF